MSEKRLAGEHAASLVRSGMTVGLGTGSTVRWTIEALARKVASGEIDITAVPTSEGTRALADSLSLPMKDIDDVDRLDMTIDGADEVDPHLDLIKGGGGALLREMSVASISDMLVIVVDRSKLVPRLGTRSPLPVEVVPFGVRHTLRRLRGVCGVTSAEVRSLHGAKFITDNGNLIIDLMFGEGIPDAEKTMVEVECVHGVVESGLFLGMADQVIVAEGDALRVLERAC